MNAKLQPTPTVQPFFQLAIGARFSCATFPPKFDESPMLFTKETKNVARDESGRGYDFTTLVDISCTVYELRAS